MAPSASAACVGRVTQAVNILLDPPPTSSDSLSVASQTPMEPTNAGPDDGELPRAPQTPDLTWCRFT